MIFIFDKIKMSISYHGIVGHGSGKVSLPSVSAWNYDLAVLRDPPRSIQTRKIDKPGQTSDITQMIQDSGDRACEAIMVYARGVNPMVGISFDNYGNNGGQKSGNLGSQGLNVAGKGSKSAYLPYRIMNGGAFRPPVRDQRELLPLSRQPRLSTSSFTKPGFVDYSKKVMNFSDSGEELRSIKKNEQVLKANIRPTATYKLETPIIENYEVKHVIKNPVQVEGVSGIQPIAKFNAQVGEVKSRINNDPLKADLNINLSDKKKNIDINLDTRKYTQDVIHNDVSAIQTRNISNKPIDQSYYVNTNPYTQDVIHNDISAVQSRNIDNNYIDEMYHMDTNKYTQDVMYNDVSAIQTRNIDNNPIDEIYHVNTNPYTQDVIHNDVDASLSKNIAVTSIDKLMNLRTQNYIQDVMYNDVDANLSRNIAVTSIDELINFDTDRMTKDIYNIDYTAPEKGHNKYDYFHSDPNLMRSLPYHESRTNIGKNVYKRLEGQKTEREYTQNRPTPEIFSNSGGGRFQKIDTITKRDLSLRPTVNAGGFDPTPTIPTSDRDNRIVEFDPQKSQMRSKIYQMQQDRNVFLGSMPPGFER